MTRFTRSVFRSIVLALPVIAALAAAAPRLRY